MGVMKAYFSWAHYLKVQYGDNLKCSPKTSGFFGLAVWHKTCQYLVMQPMRGHLGPSNWPELQVEVGYSELCNLHTIVLGNLTGLCLLGHYHELNFTMMVHCGWQFQIILTFPPLPLPIKYTLEPMCKTSRLGGRKLLHQDNLHLLPASVWG